MGEGFLSEEDSSCFLIIGNVQILWWQILQGCEVILILLLSSFVKEVASEASRTTLASHDLPQIIRKKIPH